MVSYVCSCGTGEECSTGVLGRPSNTARIFVGRNRLQIRSRALAHFDHRTPSLIIFVSNFMYNGVVELRRTIGCLGTFQMFKLVAMTCSFYCVYMYIKKNYPLLNASLLLEIIFAVSFSWYKIFLPVLIVSFFSLFFWVDSKVALYCLVSHKHRR